MAATNSGSNSATPSTKVVVIYAHSAPHNSRVNRRLALAARAVQGVEVLDLYESYPDFYIDVAREQQRIAHADTIVFMHPIHWYSMPALLKEWVDCVLAAGWAYGAGGTALAGKRYWLVASTGSPADSYSDGGSQGFAFDAFLPPFRQTAQLCGMLWEPPHILHGAHQVATSVVDQHVAAFTARLAQLASTTATA